MRLTEPANGVDDLYFIHGDQSGSTVLITDDAGQEVGRAHYEPFGETFSSTIPMTLTERLFSGQVLDSSTGLYYYGNGRYYDPSIGRYISPDPYLDAPFSSQRLDRYNFGFNNPLRYKRSAALPDFTVDVAKGVIMSEGLPAATLTSNFGQVAVDQTFLRTALEGTVGGIVDSVEQRVFGGLLIGRFTITASRNKLTRTLPGAVRSQIRELFPGVSDLKPTGQKQTVLSMQMIKRGAWFRRLKAQITSHKDHPMSRKWAAEVVDDFVNLPIGAVLAAGATDAALQAMEDWPRMSLYGLSGSQMLWRATSAGVGATIGTLVIMALLCTPTPPAWAAVPFAIVFAAAWEKGVTPWVYTTWGLYGRYEFRPPGRRLDPGLLGRRRAIF
jgi:RHS repeat-associated protein